MSQHDLGPDYYRSLESDQKLGAVLHQARQTSDVYPFPVRSVGEIARQIAVAPPPRWIVRGFLVEADYGALGAERKFGKTWLVGDLGVNVAGGGRFLGKYDVEHAGTVLLFAGEGGERKLVRRLSAVAAFYGFDLDDLPIMIYERAPKLGNVEQLARFELTVRDVRPALTIIDPAYLAMTGAKSSDLVGMGGFLEAAQHVCQPAGSALLFTHHWNKTGTGTGADRFTGSGFTEWARIIGSGSTQSTKVDADTRRSDHVCKVEWIGDEIPDLSIVYKRSVWVEGDDPTDLSAPMRYEVHVIESADLPPVDDPVVAGLKIGARRVLDVLKAEPDRWMSKRDIGDKLADTGHPLQSRTILDYAKTLVDIGLAQAFTGPSHNEATSWKAAA